MYNWILYVFRKVSEIMVLKTVITLVALVRRLKSEIHSKICESVFAK